MRIGVPLSAAKLEPAAFVRGERLEDVVARVEATPLEAKRSGTDRVVVATA